MLTIQEWHEIFKVIFIGFAISLIGLAILYKYAEVSYKKVHKGTKKTQKGTKKHKNIQIVYNIGDRNKMYLFEINKLENQMKRELIINA